MIPVTEQDEDEFLQWLYGPPRKEEDMIDLTETQFQVRCSGCGRLAWVEQPDIREPCVTCGFTRTPTGRFIVPHLDIPNTTKYDESVPHTLLAGVDPEREYTLILPKP